MENDEQENGMSKEENFEQSRAVDREKILEQSRAENKDGDEREKQYLYRGAYLATAVGFLLYGIISIVLAFLDKRMPYEMNIVTFAILGTMYLIFGIKTSKRKPLFLATGIVCLVSCLIALVCWILDLSGVMQ